MNEDRYTPEDQQTTQQLSAAPKPKLEAAAREAIRQQMLNEFRSTPISTPRRIPQQRLVRLIWRPAALAAAVAVIAIGGVLVQNSNRQAATQNSATLTSDENHQTVEMPTVTSAVTMVAVVPTQLFPLPTLTAPETTITRAPMQSPSATFAPTQPLTTPTSLQQAPTQPPTAIFTPTLPDGENVIVVIEGPITSIVDNTLTINDFNIQVASDNPILSVIDVGDMVHIEGALNSSDVIVANVVSNITDPTSTGSTPVTVGLDGPVESINGNELVVNDVKVRLDPSNPLVGTLHIGDFVRVQGNFQGSAATTVLVVVNITIVNNVVVNGTPTCRYDVDAMGMGHWHCDGMGMGDPLIGMGDDGMGDPAMGVGDDGMGMGDDGMGMGEPGMGMGP